MRIVRAFCWHVKYFLGVRYKVSGLEHFQTEGPYVILCNHQSTLDILEAPYNNSCSVLYNSEVLRECCFVELSEVITAASLAVRQS
ncbi:1-acyl-sn-glycerol-3-phosphate acyltransferase alpha [Acipenser ruthenus]|uniref:1-acylglycerol-3-phosphate O-acyltransferase n=1 Tax=Acipenser ruthenus TaxID=7906 RepID=A0A444US82_ACIRT|nr:1-acyl-sn-glycerol-3-phosphate acyltransferase alpha [Acipenser ruthenus]